jgi:hypothetical protein
MTHRAILNGDLTNHECNNAFSVAEIYLNWDRAKFVNQSLTLVFNAYT